MSRHIGSALVSYRALGGGARRYLLHVALSTAALTIPQLFYNLAVLALGYPRTLLGALSTVTFVVAAALGGPLWLLAGRLGLVRALAAAGALQAIGLALFAGGRIELLYVSAACFGAASVLAQVSATPLQMRLSDATQRDALFSAASAVALGVSGLSALLAGGLPGALVRGGWASGAAGGYLAAHGVAAAGAALAVLPLIGLEMRGPANQRTSEPANQRTSELANQRTSELENQRTSEPTNQKTSELEDQTERSDQTERQRPDGAAASWRARVDATLELLPPWRELATLLLPIALISIGAALLIPYLNLFFHDRFGVDDVTLGAIFAGLDVATGAALLCGPALAMRFGAMRTLMVTRALALPCTLLLGFAPLLGVAVGAALLRVVLFNMASPLYDAYAMGRCAPRGRTLLVGLLGAASSVGYAVGPLISTAVQQRYGWAPLFVAVTAIYGLSVLALWPAMSSQARA